jgi:hypothetical protein
MGIHGWILIKIIWHTVKRIKFKNKNSGILYSNISFYLQFGYYLSIFSVFLEKLNKNQLKIYSRQENFWKMDKTS